MSSSHAPDDKPISHEDLLQYMQQLHYKINKSGMCYGFAYMGLQAILAEGLETYNRRLQVIKGISLEEIKQEIERVTNKIKESKQKIHTLEELERLLPDQRDRDILNIPAFFDGVALYFQPEKYQYLFEEKMRPRSQNDAELTFSRVLPKDLITEEKEGKKSNVGKIASFSGIYDKNELVTYFNILSKTSAAEQPIGFVLSSSNHTVTVGYDSKTKTWQWINSSEAKKIKNADEFANLVMQAFSENNITAFSTKIYIKNSKRDRVEEHLYACIEDQKWKDIHNLSEKADSKDSNGASLLYIASANGDGEEVDDLLLKTENPNPALTDGTTPLYIAAQNGHIYVVNSLLSAGADPNLTRKDGATPLYIAVLHGRADIAESLLDNGAKPNLAIDNGATPLHIAAHDGRADIVKLLLDDKRTDPNPVNTFGKTPLQIAKQNNRDDIIKLLLAAIQTRKDSSKESLFSRFFKPFTDMMTTEKKPDQSKTLKNK